MGGRSQEADMKEKEILSSFSFFCLRRALHSETEKRREEKGGQKYQQWGDEDNGKLEKPDLHKNSPSSQVECPLWAFTLRHQGTVKRRTIKRRWCEHLKIQPYLHATSGKQGAILTGPPPAPAPLGLAVTVHLTRPPTLAHWVHTARQLAYRDKHKGLPTLRL